MRYFISLFFVCICSFNLVGKPLNVTDLEVILNDLYRVNGNQVYLKPSIHILKDDSFAARYLKRTNRIEISTKLLSVTETFENNTKDVLAFVIGHELAHVFQSDYHGPSTSFLAYDYHLEASQYFEESADVQGLFMTYLAGYKSYLYLEDFVTILYSSFELSSSLQKYPTMEERLETTTKVVRMAKELIDVFEAANYLTGIGRYRLAISCYQYISNWYYGAEVYNNIGISFALLALNFSDKNHYPLIYPFELDSEIRFRKPQFNRGVDDVDSIVQRMKLSFLVESEKSFELACKMNPFNNDYKINLLCVDILKGNPQRVIDEIESKEIFNNFELLVNNDDVNIKLELLEANAYALVDKEKEAIDKWNQIILSKHMVYSDCAEFNLKATLDKNCDLAQKVECADSFGNQGLIDGVRLHRVNFHTDAILLEDYFNTKLEIQNYSTSKVYLFSSPREKFVLQTSDKITGIVTPNELGGLPLITSSGKYSHCLNTKTIYKLDNKDKVKEIAKYN